MKSIQVCVAGSAVDDISRLVHNGPFVPNGLLGELSTCQDAGDRHA